MKKINEDDDNQQKIIFLKAILLGIKYGKMENSDLYEQSILHELQKVKKNDENYTHQLLNHIDVKINKTKILKNIYDLEQLRTNIIKNINNLSYNNYNNNIVKINYLRNNLILLNKELDQLNQKLNNIKKNNQINEPSVEPSNQETTSDPSNQEIV